MWFVKSHQVNNQHDQIVLITLELEFPSIFVNAGQANSGTKLASVEFWGKKWWPVLLKLSLSNPVKCTHPTIFAAAKLLESSGGTCNSTIIN